MATDRAYRVGERAEGGRIHCGERGLGIVVCGTEVGYRDRVFTGQTATPAYHRGDHAGFEEVEDSVGRLRVDATEHGCSTSTVEGDDVEADGFAPGDGLFGEVEVGRQVPEGASDDRACGGCVHRPNVASPCVRRANAAFDCGRVAWPRPMDCPSPPGVARDRCRDLLKLRADIGVDW